MDENDKENAENNLADLILILQYIWEGEEGSDKFWDKDKDWLLDDSGARVYL
jgi:hypothetical protein